MKSDPFPFRALTVILTVLRALPGFAASRGAPQLPNPGNAGMWRDDQEKLGLQAVGEVYKQMPVLPDSTPIAQYVQQLGAKLEKQVPSQYSWPYQFHVIQQKEINAFALPGGPIFINVGTINAAANEAQLAGVMAHEMSHVYMQHSAKQQTSAAHTLAELLGAAAGMLGGSALGDLARVGIQFGAGTVLMKYSRGDEAQADSVGAIIMYKAGYNPVELANFFEVLAKQGGAPPQFLSDHPNPGNRSEAIAKEIRYWPTQKYSANNQYFASAKKQAGGVKSYSAQEISDGAKNGLWAKQNVQGGAMPPGTSQTSTAGAATSTDVTFDQIKPSSRFTETHQNGFSISYPSNWGLATGQNSITIAPQAGVNQNAVSHGIIVSTTQDVKAGSLDQVTKDFIQNLQQSNPGMRQNGEPRGLDVNGTQGREVDLSSDSPLQKNGKPLPEHDWLVLTPGTGGAYLYLIFIAPERDFGTLKPTYQRALDSLRVE